MKIDIILHFESKKETCYNFRIAIRPRYINAVARVHSGINTRLLVEKIRTIRWDLTDYREHYQWVKNAWFDSTVKPPYNFNDYDPIPF